MAITPSYKRTTRSNLIFGLVLAGFVSYIGYAEIERRQRRAPLDELRPPTHPISLVGAELKGQMNAPGALIVFSDFICPACARFALETLPDIERRFVSDGRLLLALRHAPIGKFHALGARAAEAAHCAGKQGRFWEMYNSIFRSQLTREYGRSDLEIFEADLSAFVDALKLSPRTFAQCLESDETASRVYTDAGSALAVGVEGTPAILVGRRLENGRVRVTRHFSGRPTDEALFAAIESAVASSSSELTDTARQRP